MRPALLGLLLLLLGLVPGLAAEAGVQIPNFVDETASSGVNSVYTGDWEFTVGGGVAAFDCSGDGYPDMLLAGGTSPAKLYRNVGKRGGPLRFEEVKDSGLELTNVIGAYPLDIDGDGIPDIVLLRSGETVLMRGLGNCKFERANEAWGFQGGDAWTTSFAATWERGQVWPTLAIGAYVDRHQDTSPWGTCTTNWLYRPLTIDGKPQRKFGPPIPLTPSYCALSMLFSDWNRSGTPSLRVSNDREYYEGGQEQLWHVDPGQPPRLYTEAEGWKQLRTWGMGIASADVNASGYPQYFISSMADNKLQALATAPFGGEARPDYTDIAFAHSLTAHRPYTGTDLRPSTAWHAQFEDVNNDGRLDLFIAKGNVDKMPDFAAKDPNNLLLQRADGKFQEAGEAAGVASFAIGRGAALADFNLDGWMDLVVVNRRENVKLWRNASTFVGGWLEVKLLQPGPNRDGIGAWIEVRRDGTVTRREITSGGGHASGQLGWWHFGLGDTAKPEIRVIWPDGTASEWQSVAGNAFYVIERDRPAQAWTPE